MIYNKIFYSVTQAPECLSIDDNNQVVLTLTEGFTTIEDKAFGQSVYRGDFERGTYEDVYIKPDLEIINLPASIKEIKIYEENHWFGGVYKYSPFHFLPNLKAINVDSKNPYFKSVDGVLYNKDMTKIIFFPKNSYLKEWTTPDTLTTLPYRLFRGNKTLEKLVIGENIRSIEESAVLDCQLKEVELKTKKVSIHQINFYSNPHLKFIKMSHALDNTLLGNSKFNKIKYTDKRSISNRTIAEYEINNYTATFKDVEEDDELYNILHIPEGVKNFSNQAFYYNKQISEPTGSWAVTCYHWEDTPLIDKLRTVYIPSTLQFISAGCFKLCKDLKDVFVDEKNPKYASVDGVVYTKDLKTLVFFPPKHKKSFHITKDMNNINFVNLNDAEGITIDPENENYTMVDNVIYNKDLTELIYYPSYLDEDVWTCPESVKTFKKHCFYKPFYLREIIIPKSDKIIKLENDFIVCEDFFTLDSITIGCKDVITPEKYNFKEFEKVILSINNRLQFIIPSEKVSYLEKRV